MAFVTPLNWNLAKSDLDGKVLILGDSQTTFSSIRWGGYLAQTADEFSRDLMGVQAIPASTGFGSMGLENVLGDGTATPLPSGVTYGEPVSTNEGTAWQAKNDPNMHIYRDGEFRFAVNTANFEDLLDVIVDTNNYPGLDASGPMCFTVLTHNPTTGVERINLQEARGSSLPPVFGNTGNYGNGGSGTHIAGELSWDETGDAYFIRKGIRGNDSWPQGSRYIGGRIQTSGTDETSTQFRILSTIIHKSGGTDAAPTSSIDQPGALYFIEGFSGWSAYDHLNSVDNEAFDVAVRAVDGFDVVLICLGHNSEDSGTYTANMSALADRVIARHTAEGKAAPKVVYVAQWAFGDAAARSRMATQATDLFNLAYTEGRGFVNRYLEYGETDPATHGERFDGTATTYNMDTGSNAGLHPTDSTTAQNIARDLAEHFEDGNRTTTLQTAGGTRLRDRFRTR